MSETNTGMRRFGKHPAKHDYRTLRLKDYLESGIAPPPDSHNTLTRVYDNLRVKDPTKLFPMDGNDNLGDCTIAALAHAVTLYHGLVGHQAPIMAEKQIIKLYMKLTGGLDSGLNELDVLNYWRQKQVGGDKIMAFAKLDYRDHTHVKQAISLFGGVYLGFQVQANCETDFRARKTWTPGKLTNDGHAVFVVGYDKETVTVLTWGNTQQGTWKWWDECVDEAYAIVPQEAKNPKFAPGFNFKQLLDDLNDVADLS
jgi:hypothetical protein